MRKNYCVILVLILLTGYVKASSAPGPLVLATKGGLWPKAQQQNTTETYCILRPTRFNFILANKSHSNCKILKASLERYWQLIQDSNNHLVLVEKAPEDEAFLGYLDDLTVNLKGDCDDNEYPDIGMDEAYKLWVTESNRKLEASSIWGILRGLESFSQLIYFNENSLSLNSTLIKDFPRYKHRGLLIDTSRHFIPLEKVFQTLDAMSYNKMNVLHWHIVDDQSFPYVSRKFPELSEKGAYNPSNKIYYPEDIERVIEYARLRGIRVMPEFDSPGHTKSWGLSHPELLTPCSELNDYGPMDPSKTETYQFLQDLFAEIRDVFQDDYVHLGGDEVDFGCWIANKNITEFMKRMNITTYEKLESYYIQKVIGLVEDLKFKSVVWEEVFTNGVRLPKETLVHVWKGDWTTTMYNVTASGQPALLSSCWYLDYLSSGGDWENFYNCEPTDFNGTDQQQKLLLGGEACMWGEVVNEHNIISRVWPRASATAEKLWSPYTGEYDLSEQARRLEEHTCRMNRRGIGAEPPNGPGYCD